MIASQAVEFLCNVNESSGYSETLRENQLALFVYMIILTVVTILPNFLTVFAYWKSRRLKEKKANFMIMLMSSNDLVSGLMFNVLLYLLWKEYNLYKVFCHLEVLMFFLLLCSIICSLMTLTVMSLERYTAICYPLYHRRKVTKRRLMKLTVALWFFTTALVASLAFQFVILTHIISAAFVFFEANLIFISVKIILTHKNSRNKFRINPVAKTGLQNQRNASLNWKLTKLCLIVVFFFTFINLPFVLVISAEAFFVKNEISSDIHIILRKWSIAIALLNPSVNSVVFFWRNKELRQEALSIIQKLLQRE